MSPRLQVAERDHIIIPARLLYTVFFALAASLIMNGVSFMTNFTNSANLGLVVTYDDAGGVPTRLPISPGYAAMKVEGTMDRGRYKMTDDDADWKSLHRPRGHGFVRLGDDEHHHFYSVSMFHQLHCVDALRQIANNGCGGRSKCMGHAYHCVTYLRQMITCNADIALEPAFYVRNTSSLEEMDIRVVGIGVTHQCRNWEEVRNFVEKNYEEWRDHDNWAW